MLHKGSWHQYHHGRDGETEAQGREVTCLRPLNKSATEPRIQAKGPECQPSTMPTRYQCSEQGETGPWGELSVRGEGKNELRKRCSRTRQMSNAVLLRKEVRRGRSMWWRLALGQGKLLCTADEGMAAFP